VAPIYAAGEDPIEGITSTHLAAAITCHKGACVHEIKHADELPERIGHLAIPGDIVVCMGAGTITTWAAVLPDKLDAKCDELSITEPHLTPLAHGA
jgi:UDP-N-acetylmuramate--alanine ligase